VSNSDRGRILVVDDELGMREVLNVLLTRAGYAVDLESTGRRGLDRITAVEEPYDVVITDLVMPGAGGMELLAASKRCCAETQVIVITAHGSRETAVEALQGGAYDYVMKPFKNEELRLVVERALEKGRLLKENLNLRREVAGRFEIKKIVGASQAMRKVVELCRRMGALRTNVLITGQSGTGKELVARALHAFGPRSSEPFVSVNCGALPENLMESELFGHERGAFSGAAVRRIGQVEAADGGTLFLDEIGELPLELQPSFLRMLETGEVRRVGGDRATKVDVRVVAATNRDLATEVNRGTFREDLFYRLAIARVEVPPLRERGEDIPMLVEHFAHRALERQPERIDEVMRRFSPAALRTLAEYRWPGNVRELRNVVERTLALDELRIDPPSFQQRITDDRRREPAPSQELRLDVVLDLERSMSEQRVALIERFEKTFLEALMARYRGQVAPAARASQLDRSYLRRLLKKYR
jgi:two-component system, NtrC family, response regulator PilR